MSSNPQRTCMGCYIEKNKSDLIRIVKNKKEEIFIDETSKAEGRGLYLCKKLECLEKLKKNNRLEKLFHIKIDKDIYEKLRGVIVDK